MYSLEKLPRFQLKKKVSNSVRKLSAGKGVKDDALQYSVGQKVYGGNIICDILFDEKDKSWNIYVQNDEEEIVHWKKFNAHVAVTVEYDTTNF